MSYECHVCGQEHPGPPSSWGPPAPDAWGLLNESQRSEGELSSDQCVLSDGERGRCFVLGRLEIPVHGQPESFAWLVWVEVQPIDLQDMHEKWLQQGRESTSPYEGLLANHLSIYKHDTLGLPVRLHTRPVGERPFIEVAGEHHLATEQQEGIEESRVQEIAEILSH